MINTPTIIQPTTNSTTAFQVLNATGTQLLQADTLNGNVSVGGNLQISGTTVITSGRGLSNITSYSQTSGAATFKTTNSATAFQIQNSSSIPIFDVDTTSNLSGNLLTNYGFEVNTTGWANITGGTLTRQTTVTNAYHGQASGQVVATATANAGTRTTAFTGTLAANTYTFSFYAKVNSGTFNTLLAGYNASSDVACTLNSTTVATNGFQRYWCTFTTTANLASVWIEQTDATARTFYIDAAQLVLGSSPDPYSANGAIQLRGAIATPTDFQNYSDSTTAFQIQNSAGNSNLMVADTLNSLVGIGMAPVASGATLQVNGTISATSNIGFSNTGNANQAISLNMVVTPAVSANNVVVVDPTHAGQVTTVAATNSGTVFGVTTTTNASAGVAQPIVTSGIYQVMADTGAVNVGDTLVTSATAGDVTSNSSPAVGAVLGHALSAKASGSTGLVWVSLAPGTGSGDYTPVGTLSAYSGGTVPSGWLAADGSSVLRSAYPDLFNAVVASKGTTTVTIASPGVFTLSSHGLSIGDKVFLETTGALPTGLAADTTYCVATVPTTSTFTLGTYTQSTQSCSTTPINTSGTQSGIHTLYYAPYGVADSSHFYLPDMRGRTAVGVNTAESGRSDVNTLGNNENVAIGSRTSYHKSTKNGSASMTGSNSSLYLGGSNSSLGLGGFQAFNSAASSGSTGTGGGDRNLVSPGLSGSNSSLYLGGSNSTIGVSDTITIGPQTNTPTDTAAYLTVNYIIKAGASVSTAAANGFIQNSTSTQTANFNIQGSGTGNVVAVIQGSSGQSADILDVRDSSSNNLLSVDASGNLSVKGNIGFANSGNANQGITLNEVVTSAVTAGDVVVIDTTNAGQVTDSTTANSTKVFGIATQTKTAGQSQPIVISGIYQVNVGSNSINVGDYLVTDTNTGEANSSTSPTGGVIGQAMSTASSNKVWARISPASGAGGGSSSGSSNNYGLMESDWVDTGANIPSTLVYNSQVVTYNNNIYMLGGYINGAASNKIYSAPVSNPTNWTYTGATIPGVLQKSQALVIGANVYLFGGTNASTASNVIYTAPLSGIASTASWSSSGTLYQATYGSQAAVIGNYVYLFGGYNGSATATIQRAPISSPTTWSNYSTIPAGLYASQLAVIGNYVYLFGGDDGSGVGSRVIYRASTANLASWTTYTNALPANIVNSSLAIIGNYVYMFGGEAGSSTLTNIYRAPINSPVKGWVDTNNNLPTSLDGSSLAIAGNAVYLFGGYSSSVIGEIYSAPIYNGSPDVSSNPSWKVDSNAGTGGGSGTSSQTTSGNYELAYSQFTSNVSVTHTTEATADTVVSATSITADGSTPIYLQFFAPSWIGTDTRNNLNLYLYDGSTSLGELNVDRTTINASDAMGQLSGFTRITPSAGSHTYSIRATVQSGTGTIYAGVGGTGNYTPGFIRITLANPNLQGGAGIQNGTTTQTGNFNIQSSSASNPTAVIQGATSQSADILDVKNGSGNIVFSVGPTGGATLAGTLGFANTGNANQGISMSMVVTSATTAGDVVVIDTTNAGQVTDSTTANSKQIFGIATTTNTAGLAQQIMTSGMYQVNVDTAAVNIGDYIVTSSTTGRATSSSAPTGGVVGQAMSAKTSGSNGTVWVRINPSTGAGGGSSSSSSNNYGLMESDFVNTGATLPATIWAAQTATIGNTIYLFGGSVAGTVSNKIYSAPVSNPTNWTDTGSTLPGALYLSQIAVIGSNIYLFGGNTGTSSSVIYTASVANPLSWSSAGNLPTTLHGASLAIIGSYVYLFGGNTGAGGNTTIYRASLSSPTSWASAGSIPAALQYSSIAVIGNYVYMFGGDSSSAILRAPVSNPTSWTNMGNLLPSTLGYSTLQIIGNYVYLLGGYNSGYTSTIYRAPLSNPVNGWTNIGSTLPSILGYTSSYIAGNAVYLVGGQNSGGAANTIFSAPIYSGSPDVSSNPSWKVDSNYSSGGGSGTSSQTSNGNYELAYSQITSGVTTTATTQATATTVVSAPSTTFDGATPVMVEFFAPTIDNTSSGGTVNLALYDGSTVVSYIGQTSVSSGRIWVNSSVAQRIVPSAGAHTYSIRVYVDTGTGAVQAGTGVGGALPPGYIRITLANSSLQGGSGIANSTTTQTGNINIQSSSASNPTVVVQGATSQSADILDVKNAAGSILFNVDPSGNIAVAGNASVTGNLTVSGSLITNGSSMYGTTLPSSPVNGQEFYYVADATNGVIWHLRYNSSEPTYKWEYLGGSSLTQQISTDESTNTQNAWVNLTTNGPSITLPRSGDYLVRYGALMNTNNQGVLAVGPAIGDTTPMVNASVSVSTSGGYENGSGSWVATGRSASDILKLRYYTNVSTGYYQFRYIEVIPIRIN